MPETDIEREERRAARRLRRIKMPEVITAPADEIAAHPDYLRILAILLWCLRWLGRSASRRYFPDIGADVLRDYHGEFRDADGKLLTIDDLDEELGGPNFDVLRTLMSVPLKSDPWVPQRASLGIIKKSVVLIQAGGPRLWRDLDGRFPTMR